MRFLDEKAAAARLGISTRSLQRWRAIGGGPRWTRLGARRVGYCEAEIAAWTARSTYEHRAAEMARKAA